MRLAKALLTERAPRMADTSQHELSEPHTNGVIDGLTEEEKSKMRPADIDADMREMERRKRVEIIMNSKMFKEELERIIETQLKDGSGPCGLLQQITEMMGAQGARFNANVFKNSNCVVPINDIRGVEAKGYERGEKLLRCKLAAVFRLLDLYGWTQGLAGQITARLNADEEHFLVNPFGLLYHEITASSLVKVDMQGQVVEQGTTNFGVHVAEFQLHSTIHAARPDIKCIIHITTPTVTAVSSLKCGLLPIGPESIVIGDVSIHQYIGETLEPEEREKITRNLGPINKVMLLTNRGALCCGETIEEAFYNVYNTVLACETQLKLMPMGVENLNLLSEESKKSIYEASRKPPIPHTSSIIEPSPLAEKLEKRWRIGAASKGIIQRNFQHNAMVYKTPYAKNPFDAVTDQELDQYKKEVERKTKGDIYDESQSESEALSSFNISRATHESSTAKSPIQSPISVTSETEEESRDEPRVLRIETKRVPKPSQAEVVLSDGKMHEHENDADKSTSNSVTVSNLPTQTVTTQSQIVPSNRQKIGVDPTTEFLNEMRRSAIEPMNNRSKRDYEASSNDEGSEEIPVGEYGRWRLDVHEEIHLERTKLITLTPLKSLNPQSKSLDNLNIFGVSSPKYKSTYPNLNSRIKSYRRRIFFDQYDKVYAQYKNSNLTIQASQSTSDVNLNFNNTNQGHQSSVKQLISKYSSLALNGRNINDNTENNININTGLIKSRKRAYVSIASSSCSICKLPRLSLSVLKLQDLQSPRLVEEAMNRQVLSETCMETESHLKECELRPVPVDLPVSPISMSALYKFGEVQYESTPVKDVQVSKDCLPTAGNFEFVNTDANVSEADVNGNIANPLSITSSGEKLTSDQEPSSEDVASIQTVVEKNLDCAVTEEKNLITETDSISPELIDNLEWFNEPLDTLESSFAKELNDSQPWRFSSPLVSGKKYQREDSITEVIDSINVNLTPSKSMRSLNFHLPSSDASMKYNLNSSHMSVIYSLTPTVEIQDGEESNEHIYCGKKCPQCLILAPVGNLSPTDHDSFYIWDDPIAEDEEKEDNVVDLNKTIDLFDNSIELEANITHESADFELPEIKVEDEGEFHKDIETTVNEIIEGLEERATLIEANILVDNVIDSACIKVSAVKSLEDLDRFDGSENAEHDAKNEIVAPLDNEEAYLADNGEGTRVSKEEIDFAGEVACKVEDDRNAEDIEIKKDISSVEEDGIGTERLVTKEEADSKIEDEDDFASLEKFFEEEIKPEVHTESHSEKAKTEEQMDPEEVKEEISEIIHKISFNEDSEENIADKYTVIDEIIHHIIDKDSSNSSEQALERQDSHESQEKSPRDTSESSESFNLKKVKENTNTEIKEMQIQQDSSLKIVDENVECKESKEDFISKLKAITEDVNFLDEDRIKEIFFSGVINDLHLNPDGELTAAESTEILQKLKCIAEQVNVDESTKALNGLETGNGDSIYSDAMKQFKNQVEKIFKNSQASLAELNDDNVNIVNTAGKEIDSMEVDGHNEEDIVVNSSEQNEESEREEMSVDNTKSDDSKEKSEVTGKTVKFCIIEYQGEVSSCKEVQNEVDEAEEIQEAGAQSSDGRESSESDESDSLVKNLSDGEKEALKLWKMAESEIERSYNGNISTTFVEYDHVDDVLDTVDANPLVHYPTHHDLRLDSLDEALNVSITRCKDKISLSTISEDDESESEDEVSFISSPIKSINSPMKITKVDSVCSLESIQEIDEDDIDIDIEIGNVRHDVNAKPVDVSDDDSDSVVIMSIKNIFREDDDLKIIYENFNNDIYHDDDINIIREIVIDKPVINLDENHCSIENVNELKQTSSSLTEFHSCQEELSNQESFETCISHQSAQTITPRSDNNEVNSETYTISDNDADDDCTSEMVGIPRDTMYNADVSNDFCDSLIMNDSAKEFMLQKNDTCRNCLMTMSMDTRDFIRLERQVVQEENINCNITLNVSPIKAPPMYENTTLCKVVSENTVNGDHSDAHHSTFSHSSKEGSMSQDVSVSEESPKKEKKKKKGLRTPSFLKKKKEKKKSVEA
ncbi:hypothetical protein G9C98_002018 [Cotesia typhae]|uniref:Class II aldolase/adducin N-terminal domain-containing protein n=1 Tax=Cotesia typhae TaxID=2053667 RepID=A0A8J5QSC8_9HYME|nr:hypothetical protein G9C98_002018 [Cotesia typhae]